MASLWPGSTPHDHLGSPRQAGQVRGGQVHGGMVCERGCCSWACPTRAHRGKDVSPHVHAPSPTTEPARMSPRPASSGPLHDASHAGAAHLMPGLSSRRAGQYALASTVVAVRLPWWITRVGVALDLAPSRCAQYLRRPHRRSQPRSLYPWIRRSVTAVAARFASASTETSSASLPTASPPPIAAAVPILPVAAPTPREVRRPGFRLLVVGPPPPSLPPRLGGFLDLDLQPGAPQAKPEPDPLRAIAFIDAQKLPLEQGRRACRRGRVRIHVGWGTLPRAAAAPSPLP